MISEHFESAIYNYFDKAQIRYDEAHYSSIEMLKNRVKILEATLDNIGAYIHTKDCNGRYRYVNEKMLKLLGRSIDEVIGKSDKEIIDNELLIDSTLSGKLNQLVNISKGNETRKMEYFQKPMLNEKGDHIGTCNTILDVTKWYLENRELKKLAYTDYLTGLFNRRYFFKQAHELFHQASNLNKPLSVISIDIDHFKDINDQYGHSVGDNVLIAVTKMMRPNIRTEDIIARLGGEEFSIILPDTSKQKAKYIADRIRLEQDLSTITVNNLNSLKVKISIGVASLNSNDTTFDDILIRSDQALYLSKSKGRNKVHILD
ncbi:diguanylate cyclase [Colwellia sp. 1_MG-2023]|uniref:sensor domain-containing diguanylate cyclase n=1 Tax=Colwellia sp. 1_MG-2023 TaxID=3062649 RepID=UPI0026E43370|nr:sensor domain-containing diguanylate cyclase [Colwellia sp. 1_MG-2023]MDO6447374.1 diguanylate cyclase [Colwellia sp. 1_MG-2023]